MTHICTHTRCTHSHHTHLHTHTHTCTHTSHTLAHTHHTHVHTPVEAIKLQQHLDLLKEQYVKLQQKHADLEQKYTTAIATSGNVGADHFVSKLLRLVGDLYDKQLYRYVILYTGSDHMGGGFLREPFNWLVTCSSSGRLATDSWGGGRGRL